MIHLIDEQAHVALHALRTAPCDETQPYDEEQLNAVAKAFEAQLDGHDDPRRVGGSTIDTGGPHDRDSVLYDTRKAVLVEQVVVSVAHPTRNGQPAPDVVAFELVGRINRPPDDAAARRTPAEPTHILTMLSWDLAGDVVAELHALAIRDGSGDRFTTQVQAAFADLRAKGLA